MSVKLPILFCIVWLTLGCFYLSKEYAKKAHETEELCKRTQKISFGISGRPLTNFYFVNSCSISELDAEIENLNFKSSVFSVAGTGLFLTFVFLPILFWFRAEQNNKNAVESIMNSDAAKPG